MATRNEPVAWDKRKCITLDMVFQSRKRLFRAIRAMENLGFAYTVVSTNPAWVVRATIYEDDSIAEMAGVQWGEQ